eukprot:6178458-Pleurochrysis_carterae.AAC.1
MSHARTLQCVRWHHAAHLHHGARSHAATARMHTLANRVHTWHVRTTHAHNVASVPRAHAAQARLT